MTVRLDIGDPPDQLAVIPAPRPPQERPVACYCDSESFSGPGGAEILVVRVSGEVDLLTRPVLTVALLEALGRGPRHLVIDLAATTFCCTRGFEVLGETAFVAGARGIGFALSGLSVHQGRVVGLILPGPGPIRHSCVAAAVASIRAARTAPIAPRSSWSPRRGFTGP